MASISIMLVLLLTLTVVTSETSVSRIENLVTPAYVKVLRRGPAPTLLRESIESDLSTSASTSSDIIVTATPVILHQTADPMPIILAALKSISERAQQNTNNHINQIQTSQPHQFNQPSTPSDLRTLRQASDSISTTPTFSLSSLLLAPANFFGAILRALTTMGSLIGSTFARMFGSGGGISS